MADNFNINVSTIVNLNELKSLLVELQAINAEIAKMNTLSLDNVTKSTSNIVDAVGKSTNEIEKMKDVLSSSKESFDILPSSVKEASDSIIRYNEVIRKSSEETKTSREVHSGFYMELGAKIADLSLKLPNFAIQAIKAFGAEEVAIQKLSTAIRENGGNVSEVLPIMQQFASDMQKIAGYADDEILAMQGVATSMGVLPTQMQQIIQGAIGLSSALGMDLQTATRASSAAIQGKTELLTRYIPTLSTCTTEEEKLAKVQELSRNGFAQAEASMNTLEGKLKAAANAWGDLQEVIGEAFEPTVKNVAGLVQSICELFTKHDTITKVLTISLSSLAVGFAFTKVGGLLNVAKMFTGVTTATKGATTAMHAFNLAVKANPLGLIATIATGAVMGIMSLADYFAELTDEELKEADVQEAVANAKRKAMEVTQKANAIINEYNNSLKLESETAEELAGRINALTNEITNLEESRSEWAGDKQIQNAETLIAKKKELSELQKKYLETINATATAEYEFASNRETERKYRVEQELNFARKTGIAHIIKFKEAELAYVTDLEKSVELQKKYYTDHAHLVKSEEDRVRIMEEAKKYAEQSIEKTRETASIEKWLNAENEESKTKQRNLDFEILKARASGNEELAKQKEGELRIAQLANEIFEVSRKEGMSKEQLVNLQKEAEEQAKERYNLEKSITEEAQRQNLAKNAQATIEDILLKNKIEQLKAEGKMTEAKELEREREINRTLAGMGDAVSDEDKEKLRATMRQTNDYRDQQEEQRSSGGDGYAGGSYGSGGYGDSGYGGGGGRTRQGTRSRKKSSTDDKSNPLNFGTSYSVRKAETSNTKSTVRANAQNFLKNTTETARSFTSLKPRGSITKATETIGTKKTAEKPKNNNSDSEQKAEETKNQTPARQELTARANQSRNQKNNDREVLNILREIQRSVRGIEQTKV